MVIYRYYKAIQRSFNVFTAFIMEIWRNFNNLMDIYPYDMGIRRSFNILRLLSWKYEGFNTVLGSLIKIWRVLTIVWIFTVMIWEYGGVLTFLRFLLWKYRGF
jgi:hypothetical protein